MGVLTPAQTAKEPLCQLTLFLILFLTDPAWKGFQQDASPWQRGGAIELWFARNYNSSPRENKNGAVKTHGGCRARSSDDVKQLSFIMTLLPAPSRTGATYKLPSLSLSLGCSLHCTLKPMQVAQYTLVFYVSLSTWSFLVSKPYSKVAKFPELHRSSKTKLLVIGRNHKPCVNPLQAPGSYEVRSAFFPRGSFQFSFQTTVKTLSYFVWDFKQLVVHWVHIKGWLCIGMYIREMTKGRIALSCAETPGRGLRAFLPSQERGGGNCGMSCRSVLSSCASHRVCGAAEPLA